MPMPPCWCRPAAPSGCARTTSRRQRLAAEIAALAAEPDRLAAMAAAAKSAGAIDAAERLADLVLAAMRAGISRK